jgi:hypothetical protein
LYWVNLATYQDTSPYLSLAIFVTHYTLIPSNPEEPIWIVRSLLQHLHLRPIWNKEKVLAIADYSFTIWLLTLGTAIFSRGDRLIVGYYLGSESLGIYGGVTEIASAINSFSALQPIEGKGSTRKVG